MARRSLSPKVTARRDLPGHRDRQRVTVEDLAGMNALDLIDYFDSEMMDYMVPENTADPETDQDQIHRWGYTIDRIPDLYAWATRIRAVYDVLTDRARATAGQGSAAYQQMRQCRDASEAFVSVVKQRYQAASRMITIETMEKDETEMPRRR